MDEEKKDYSLTYIHAPSHSAFWLNRIDIIAGVWPSNSNEHPTNSQTKNSRTFFLLM